MKNADNIIRDNIGEEMIRFDCDYLEGAHPNIIKRLTETNMVQTVGYGNDEFCEVAREKIRTVCENEGVDVHFLVGGTQANRTVISSALRPHQGVFAVETGHINCHETGAIEATGHKVISLKGYEGKVNAAEIDEHMTNYWNDPAFEHIVQPKMVYISQTTETGTLYSQAEIDTIRAVCDKYKLYLFLDGARLGYAIAADRNDVTVPYLAKTCDIFYIGGTKVGALFGEAVVIVNDELKKEFRYAIKQHGGMFAKGRLLGLQFDELFTNGLYFEIAKNAIVMAKKLSKGFEELGIQFAEPAITNQIFVVMPNERLAKLDEKYSYDYQRRYDDKSAVVRFCTSWATKEENVDKLLGDLKEILK
jgi:threonine aldolase